TIREQGFKGPVETGAEFVHGKLPMTLGLLEAAGIGYTAIEGEMIQVQNGQWQNDEAHDPHWHQLMKQLASLPTDMSIADFLNTYFADAKYAALRQAVRGFAQGFDLADINHSSALAALHEWPHEEDEQYRVNGGYGRLVAYLLEKCAALGLQAYYNTAVTHIRYNTTTVNIQAGDKNFEANAAVITIPLSQLQANLITFSPALDEHYTAAIQSLGFGQVIKFLLQFRSPLWQQKSDNIGFLLSNEEIPTWWTQLPNDNGLLTGWLGGPPAAALSGLDDETLLQKALHSLGNILGENAATLRRELVQHRIVCWQQAKFIQGGYSYVTTGAAAAKKILEHPAGGNVYFAGEAMYRGASQGTVEAALQSGAATARRIIQQAV
ncbi:MAG TPA: NAD(P)/FAD-dependent oxidoreductase, partial [Chitinophagaceae bacterium]|nr:NAD(P)/FAD-dependent oxidoreductase [Chitinophagaceae bacterium]